MNIKCDLGGGTKHAQNVKIFPIYIEEALG